ncbi:thymidylate synthase [Polymorphobacter multimanifer]|uniref:thymidylate synthase n=1 Tax=Polymorphobacter multimanifer TaxID=1070431 RepID=UPI003571339C
MVGQDGSARHPEHQYLDLVRRVWEEGSTRIDRTGVGTRALFGATMRFDLSAGTVPLLTTKRVFWKPALRELLWFLSGSRNIRPLVADGVHIWTDWPLAKYRQQTGEAISAEDFELRIITDDAFAERWGDLGPVYGAQWRNWPRYTPTPDGQFTREPHGHDQISTLVHQLQSNPHSRRLIFSGWNVAEIDQMALPPCHMTYQYFVEDKRLSCILYQRSCDLGLGFAFNIFEASVLLHMLAKQCKMLPGEMVWMGADCHAYLNHEALITTQLQRDPRPFPKLHITRTPDSIFEYKFDDFVVEGYDPHPAIKLPVAV